MLLAGTTVRARCSPSQRVWRKSSAVVAGRKGCSVTSAPKGNGEVFYSVREAQIIIEKWRKHYNTKRPLSALGYRPPAPETIVPMASRPIMH